MIDNSNLDTPQTCRLGNTSSHLLRIPKQGVGSVGCGAIHSVVGQTNCPIDSNNKILLTKEQHSGVKEHPVNGPHLTGTVGGAAMMNIFSSPRSFACTLSSTRSTSAPYTPTVVDECSPPCSLPAPPGSDPFTISGFGPESRSIDTISGDFSAPLLNYLNDGLNSNSWGGFLLPYSKITDYCFESSPDGGILNSSGNSNNNSGCGNNNGNNNSNNNNVNNGNININSQIHNHSSHGGSSVAASKSSSIIGNSINTSKWGGNVLPKPNCVATTESVNKITPSSSPSSSTLLSPSLSSKANELLDSILMGIIKENGHTGNVFEQASNLLSSTSFLLTTRFNKELPKFQSPSNHNPIAAATPSNSPNAGNGNGNWSPTTLGVGGPNFAAPTMLAHPDEFKNPSSFLKIYGDPLCGKQAPSGNQSPPIGTIGTPSHDFQAGNVGAGFSNINPMKGQNGNWACCKCSNVNFPRRFRCFKCGEYRDEVGDKIVAEYAKHVYLHHLKAYRSFNNGNASVSNGSGSNNGSQSALSLGPNRTGIGLNISSNFNEGLQPVFIQRSNSSNGFITTTPPSNMSYIDSSGSHSSSKQQVNSVCTDGINSSGSSTCSTSPSTGVSPVGSSSMTSQAAKKSSKVSTLGI